MITPKVYAQDLKKLPQNPEESGYYTYGTPTLGRGQYGNSRALSTLFSIESRWEYNHTNRFGVGNISLKYGGPFEPHVSHQDGGEMDVRALRKDGLEAPVSWQDSQYDRAATKELIKTFKDSGNVNKIFFNDPAMPGVQPLEGHDNHFHVEFKQNAQ
ncbi:penicillin-insensitive murein endopeptidase [Solimicrobium silvestre]|uniref:penicillin-insensitive murein endopeptidase n=1 Tax=Solimicrobium silvestre TaxID=2099400 RepID=UPI001056F13B|nr:penicillin-insensitive murein endopeptidase [Solimicrobium silvestre]